MRLKGLPVMVEGQAAARILLGRRSRAFGHFLRSYPLGAVGLAILLLLSVVAIFGPLITTHSHTELAGSPYTSPNGQFVFGTDNLGRDVYSRVVLGTRIALYVGVVSVGIGATAGLIWGIFTAYVGGWLDLFSQRIIDSILAFPTLVLALVLVSALGSSINNVVLAIAIVIFPGATRTIRSLALSIKERPYVEASRSIGCSNLRIMFVHILPNAIAPYMVLVSLYVGQAIITEASLSFLGLGVPPTEPSWGGMMSISATQFIAVAPWMAIFPGVAVALTVYAFNLTGDSLRDAFDPHTPDRT